MNYCILIRASSAPFARRAGSGSPRALVNSLLTLLSTHSVSTVTYLDLAADSLPHLSGGSLAGRPELKARALYVSGDELLSSPSYVILYVTPPCTTFGFRRTESRDRSPRLLERPNVSAINADGSLRARGRQAGVCSRVALPALAPGSTGRPSSPILPEARTGIHWYQLFWTFVRLKAWGISAASSVPKFEHALATYNTSKLPHAS